MRTCSPVSSRICPSRRCERSSVGPRACRSTRSRRCACSSTAGTGRRRMGATGSPGSCLIWPCRRPSSALIAARLDAAGPDDRSLITDASVLGLTFTPDALAAVSGRSSDGARRGPGAPGPARAPGPRRGSAIARARPASVRPGRRAGGRLPVAGPARSTEPAPGRGALLRVARRGGAHGVLASHYVAAHRATLPGPEADALAARPGSPFARPPSAPRAARGRQRARVRGAGPGGDAGPQRTAALHEEAVDCDDPGQGHAGDGPCGEAEHIHTAATIDSVCSVPGGLPPGPPVRAR